MGKSANINAAEAESQHHIPALLQEVLKGLALQANGRYLDATLGGAGHAIAILEATAPNGRLLGLDRDPEAAVRAAMRLALFKNRAEVIHASYTQLGEIARKASFIPLDGVLFDLGFSSWQIDDVGRGFSFSQDGPLDMRFDRTGNSPSAADVVNQWPESDLANILYRYGEEPRSRHIAQAIVAARPIYNTRQLADVIVTAVGRGQHERIHPATRTFQALRIAVNDELEGIIEALPQAVAALRTGGRLAVITFHSLEDRIVKQYFKQEARGCICPPEAPICTCDHQPTVHVLTRKPIVPSQKEIQVNPRSRSAKLRIVEKLGANSLKSAGQPQT